MESLEYPIRTAPPESGDGPIATEEDLDAAEQEVERLNRELAIERERRLRLAADFDNYRRRSRQDLIGARESGRRDVLLALVDVMDDFDRALAHLGDASDAVSDGLHLTRRRHDDLLQSFGVTAFESEGCRFDPTVHEALGVVECDTHEPGTVHSEVRRGYRWNGELLRPARVMVAEWRPTRTEESWIRTDLS